MEQLTPRAITGYGLIPTRRGFRGLGQEPFGSSLAIAGSQAGGSLVNAATASGQVKGYSTGQAAARVGSSAAAGFMAGGPIGAGVAAAVTAIQLLFSRKGPKQKVATTKIVNQVEPILQQNLAAYRAGPHTASSQQAALYVFDQGWAYVVEYCDTPAMGAPGKACVSERSAGGKWDWFSYYRDPIANDPNVVPDETAIIDEAGNAVGNTVAAASSSVLGISLDPKLLLGVALIGGALLLLGGGSGDRKRNGGHR